jgi:hypothetical protein
MPSIGFVTNGVVDDTSDDVTPPSVLMEHPPLAVFVNGRFYLFQELTCIHHLLTLMVLTSIQVDMFLFQTLGCRCFGSNE